ncbi:c-type cytochrome [Flavobacteriaceae bacterium SZ-1-7]|uniref:c-type cytochrome n=1 Tax=Tamlana sedimenti TaxID=3134126 RepID=UPI00312A6C01
MQDDAFHMYKKATRLVLIYFSSIIILAVLFLFCCFDVIPLSGFKSGHKLSSIYDKNYDVSLVSNSKDNEMLKYGYELFSKTPKYLGPDNGNPQMVYQGNRLACRNCHLNLGTQPFSAPLIGIIQRFPQFRGRENKIGTIEERINGCMERSMNGRVLPEDSKEMRAIVSYLEWLSRHAPKDGKIKGTGFVKLEIPNRAVNLDNGNKVFTKHCVTCHGKNGQGKKAIDGYTYEYPPLWGENSFNNGAGMNRVITAAKFIKGNMPFELASYDVPVLTDEEAYDVAGYINQKPRPQKQNPERDFPDLKKKPVSTPYPPYADDFSIEQHQLGPFQPIMAFYKEKYNITKTK